MSPDTPAADTPADTPPNGLSRRRLMRQAAAVGAAGLAATLVTGAGAGTAAAADDAPAADPHRAPVPDHDEPMIVHVRDIRSGHLDVYSGERHQRVQDPALAAALARALA
ncbi:hypothetical protein ABTY61_36980 [Kitasatospora sp. NPDC096128]|uniref:hypothetical protein n=1 Tax=Kitasatospora sp. NPDC096128 TaxID=3155547 RepID=UPI00331BD0AF